MYLLKSYEPSCRVVFLFPLFPQLETVVFDPTGGEIAQRKQGTSILRDNSLFAPVEIATQSIANDCLFFFFCVCMSGLFLFPESRTWQFSPWPSSGLAYFSGKEKREKRIRIGKSRVPG